MTLVLETLGSNQTLDAGGLGVVFLALAGDGAADDELADVILLVQTEETADLGGTLGTETLGDNGVGQTGQLLLTLLDDAEGQDGKVEVGDSTTDGLALALTSAAGAVAASNITSDQFPVRSLSLFFFFLLSVRGRGGRNLPVAVAEEETGTGGEKDCRGNR